MNDIKTADDMILNALIDELIIHIGMLKKSPDDERMANLFGKRFVRCGQLLYACGYIELSELARDIHDIFFRVFSSSGRTFHEIMRTALSFLALARKAVMFSDMPDFKETAGAEMLTLRNSLQQLCENKAAEKIDLPPGTPH